MTYLEKNIQHLVKIKIYFFFCIKLNFLVNKKGIILGLKTSILLIEFPDISLLNKAAELCKYDGNS